MQREQHLFDMVTFQPNQCIRQDCTGMTCAQCARMVTIRNDSGHRFHYCGIWESAASIIGCHPVRSNRKACRRFRRGKGELLKASAVLQPEAVI